MQELGDSKMAEEIENERRNAHFIIGMGGKCIGFVTQRYAMWHKIPSRIHDAHGEISQV